MINEEQNNSFAPIISVVLPVFNGAKYLHEAVDSILSQTFKNFELIVINDGSIDRTQEILEEYRDSDPRVVLISRENRGLVASLNEGVVISRGEWIARMDADDIALPHRFERQLQWLEETGADICGSWVRFFGTKDNRILKHAECDDAIKIELLFCCAFAHPTVVIKSEKIKSLRYDNFWDKAEDYELWTRAACNGWKMTNVPEVLLMYRQHDRQISNASSILQQNLSQSIRRMYWANFLVPMEFDVNEIDVVLKLWSPLTSKINMKKVDAVFTKLLQRSDGESSKIIFENATRLYFSVASFSINVPFYWYSLSKKFGSELFFKNFCMMIFISFLKIKVNGKFFQLFKRVFHIIRRLKNY